eukprot:1599858-Rhodomonas_salina.2
MSGFEEIPAVGESDRGGSLIGDGTVIIFGPGNGSPDTFYNGSTSTSSSSGARTWYPVPGSRRGTRNSESYVDMSRRTRQPRTRNSYHYCVLGPRALALHDDGHGAICCTRARVVT